jgi:HSP20 family protein
MLTTHWTPWQMATGTTDQLEDWLNSRNQQLFPLARNGHSRFTPAADVLEDTDKIQLVIDLPGVAEADIDLKVEKNILTVKGERKQTDGAQRLERAHGAFWRSFILPMTVDLENVAAEMKSGVLLITLPKRPETKPRQIKLKSS